MPLVLQDGDSVELAFHKSFHDVINNPKGLEDIYDIQLSEPVTGENSSVWTARLLENKNAVFEYGEYRLQTKRNGEATHVLDFVPGEMCKSTGRTESNLSNLFRFCPLVLTVHPKEANTPHTMVFLQRTGLSIKAEENRGNRHLPSEASSEASNDFQYLNFFAGDRKLDLELEVVTLTSDKRRLRNMFPFIGRVAKGDLYTTLSTTPVDLTFHDDLATVDGDAGHIKHSFICTLEPGEYNEQSTSQFKASKLTEAKFKLPWMSGKNESSIESQQTERLLKEATSGYLEKDWASKLATIAELDYRLPVSTRREDVIDHNYQQFERIVQNLTSKLGTDKGLQASTLKAEQEKEEKNRIQATIDASVAAIAEIEARKAAIEPLLVRFSKQVHKQQFVRYIDCLDEDAERLIGFQVSINLRETIKKGTKHPATKIYLIETHFEEQQ